MTGRSIQRFHLGKRGNRAAHRPHVADLANILEQIKCGLDDPFTSRSDHLIHFSYNLDTLSRCCII